MGKRTSREYVFKVTVAYEGHAPKPDAHELRRRLVDVILGSRFPSLCQLGNDEVIRSNSVTIQVQCTGDDCRPPSSDPDGFPADCGRVLKIL